MRNLTDVSVQSGLLSKRTELPDGDCNTHHQSYDTMLELGQIVATPAALHLLTENNLSPLEFLHRHINGDYGDVCASDRQANIDALRMNARVLSKYCITATDTIYVITEADRSSTCLLLCEEY